MGYSDVERNMRQGGKWENCEGHLEGEHVSNADGMDEGKGHTLSRAQEGQQMMRFPGRLRRADSMSDGMKGTHTG